MDNKESPDIIEARDLLINFEKNKDHEKRLRYFEEAIEILEHFFEDNQNSFESLIARNIINTHTRRLIEELPDPDSLDINEWFSYFLILLLKIGKYVDLVCLDKPSLKMASDNFIIKRASEAIDILKRRINT